MASIAFHSEVPSFNLKDKIKIKKWLKVLVDLHKGTIGFLQYVFCDDDYLLELNKEHLDHDTLTDIITFRYQEHPDPIDSDIYISIDRVKENAEAFGVEFENELHRVMAHGVLHLLGFKDKGDEAEKEMRQKENEALLLYNSI